MKNKAANLVQRSGDANYMTKIGVWIQFSHRKLADIYDYYTELQDIHNFTSVDGQENYPLPNRFDKPFRLYDITNDRKITVQTEFEYFDANIANIADANEGAVGVARIYGVTGSVVPIAITGDTVKIKSSSSSDTGGIIVRIRGYTDSSHLIEETESILVSTSSPTTAVAGTKTFYKITHISKSDNTTGYISVTNSSDTTIETLAPLERVAKHKVLKLGQIPDDSTTSFRLLFKRIPSELYNNEDYPFVECDEFLVTDATTRAVGQDKELGSAEFWKGEAQKALGVILQNQSSKMGPDYQQKIVSKWLNSHRR